MPTKKTTLEIPSQEDNILHVLRNPHGWSKEDVRKARIDGADLIEKQKRTLTYVSKHREKELGVLLYAQSALKEVLSDVKKGKKDNALRTLEFLINQVQKTMIRASPRSPEEL